MHTPNAIDCEQHLIFLPVNFGVVDVERQKRSSEMTNLKTMGWLSVTGQPLHLDFESGFLGSFRVMTLEKAHGPNL